MELHEFGAALSRDRADLYFSRRIDERDLQRGGAVLPDRTGVFPASDFGSDEGGRVGRPARAITAGDGACVEIRGGFVTKSDGCRDFQPGGGPGFCPLIRL